MLNMICGWCCCALLRCHCAVFPLPLAYDKIVLGLIIFDGTLKFVKVSDMEFCKFNLPPTHTLHVQAMGGKGVAGRWKQNVAAWLAVCTNSNNVIDLLLNMKLLFLQLECRSIYRKSFHFQAHSEWRRQKKKLFPCRTKKQNRFA